MHDTQTTTVMETVHAIMREEYGRQAAPLDHDDTVQRMRFPGGAYVLVIRQASDATVRVHQAVGTVDFDTPGLSSFLLSEHRTWIYGRLDREEDLLVISHSLDIAQMEGSLVKVVNAVHAMALRTESLLYRAGALTDVEAGESEEEE